MGSQVIANGIKGWNISRKMVVLLGGYDLVRLLILEIAWNLLSLACFEVIPLFTLFSNSVCMSLDVSKQQKVPLTFSRGSYTYCGILADLFKENYCVWWCVGLQSPLLKRICQQVFKPAIISIKENNDSPTAWRFIFILFRNVAWLFDVWHFC